MSSSPTTERPLPRPKMPSPATRSHTRPALEILFFTIASFYFVGLPLSMSSPGPNAENPADLAWYVDAVSNIGLAALDAAGWGLGVLVTALLAFLAITIGGNYAYDDPEDASRLLRTIAMISELIAGISLCSLAFILVACFTNPEDLGKLFYVVPATLLIVLLATEVGTFLALRPEQVIRNATKTREWARERLEEMEPFPRHSLRIVAPANIAVIAFLATMVMVPENTWFSFASTYGFFAVSTSLQVYGYTAVTAEMLSTRDRFNAGFGWVLLGIIVIITASALIAALQLGEWQASAALALSAITCLMSLLMPRIAPRSPLTDWSLGSGSKASAARSIEKQDAKAANDISSSERRLRERAADCNFRNHSN